MFQNKYGNRLIRLITKIGFRLLTDNRFQIFSDYTTLVTHLSTDRAALLRKEVEGVNHFTRKASSLVRMLIMLTCHKSPNRGGMLPILGDDGISKSLPNDGD